MEIQIDPKLLDLVPADDGDISKVMLEALDLWLKEKLPKCPITDTFCENLRGSRNSCPVTSGVRLTLMVSENVQGVAGFSFDILIAGTEIA